MINEKQSPPPANWCCVCTRELENRWSCLRISASFVALGVLCAGALLALSLAVPSLLVPASVLHVMFLALSLVTASCFGRYMCGNQMCCSEPGLRAYSMLTYCSISIYVFFTFVYVLVGGTQQRDVSWFILAQFGSACSLWLMLFASQDGETRSRECIYFLVYGIIMANVAQAPSFAWMPTVQHYALFAISCALVIFCCIGCVVGLFAQWYYESDKCIFWVSVLCWQVAAAAVWLAMLLGAFPYALDRTVFYWAQMFPIYIGLIAAVCVILWSIYKLFSFLPGCCSSMCGTIHAAVENARRHKQYDIV